MKGGASKYGTINLNNITSAGHSCGGLEAMSVCGSSFVQQGLQNV
jgi:predicted dienelactone hydrolase